MIGALRVLALVPARAGSKRVPNKNLRTAGGKSLLAWTLEAARSARCVDRVAVSSDGDAILELARQLGCDTALKRPDALATDEAPGIEPVLHAIEALPGYDIVVLLQPTSPLRRAADIDACVERCAATGTCCVSVTHSREEPEWLFRLDAQGCMIPAFSPEIGSAMGRALHVLNGAVYAACVPWLRRRRTFIASDTFAYVMPEEYSLDIDTPQDLALADMLLGGGHDGQ